MLLEQADLLCRHYVLIWMLPSRWYLPVFSVKCEMWSCWHFVYLRILNSIRLSTKLFINQSQPPRYTSILVHRSLGRSPHEVWMVERSTPARKRLAKMEYHGSIKSTKSTCEKDNHIMTTASCSTRTFSAYVCIPYSVCQQGPSIKRSLSYQTQRSYHSKSMELIWKKKPSHKMKTAFRWSEFEVQTFGEQIFEHFISWCFFLDLHHFLLNSFCFLGNILYKFPSTPDLTKL